MRLRKMPYWHKVADSGFSGHPSAILARRSHSGFASLGQSCQLAGYSGIRPGDREAMESIGMSLHCTVMDAISRCIADEAFKRFDPWEDSFLKSQMKGDSPRQRRRTAGPGALPGFLGRFQKTPSIPAIFK